MSVKFRKLYSAPIGSMQSKETNLVPNQAVSISELLARFTRGERLNIPQRPQNVCPEDEPDESPEHAQPQCEDIVDVMEYAGQVQAHKADFEERMKNKATKKKQDEPKPAPSSEPHGSVSEVPETN